MTSFLVSGNRREPRRFVICTEISVKRISLHTRAKFDSRRTNEIYSRIVDETETALSTRDEMMRSTVAPISKVGSQGHSPLPYQEKPAGAIGSAGDRVEFARVPVSSVRLAARACRPPLLCRLLCLSHSLSFFLSQDPSHTRTMPPRSVPRSTTH